MRFGRLRKNENYVENCTICYGRVTFRTVGR